MEAVQGQVVDKEARDQDSHTFIMSAYDGSTEETSRYIAPRDLTAEQMNWVERSSVL